MTLHDHWLLMAGIAVLYLYDSALLLFHNEIVLETRRTGYLVSGGSVMEFRGRHLFLPNPLCPHRALLRLSWAADESMASGALRTRGRRVRLALAVIAPWTCALLGLFFVALPCALWVGTDVLLLGWLILAYLTIAAMLWQVWRARKALSLSDKAVVALAFDALLCAPFAINMVRKISLRQELPSLRSVALSRLSPAENVVLSGILRQRIEASLGFLEPGTEASNALLAYLKRFEDGMS